MLSSTTKPEPTLDTFPDKDKAPHVGAGVGDGVSGSCVTTLDGLGEGNVRSGSSSLVVQPAATTTSRTPVKTRSERILEVSP